MGIKVFFHKLKIGFVRKGGTVIPYTSGAKQYGNEGENTLVDSLLKRLPSCRIKQNILISTPEGAAEIDILVLHRNKLFAIEVKHWKGRLAEVDGRIVQDKIDRWTDELHRKQHKSPFKQLNRAIYLLRKQIPGKVWVHPIVYFEDASWVNISEEHIWFCSVDELVSYVSTEGDTRSSEDAQKVFDACIAADVLYATSRGRTLYGQISDKSLYFPIGNRFLTRRDIWDIAIRHHWAYDELYIRTMAGEELYTVEENGFVEVFHDGWSRQYALCKIDYIQLG